MVKRFGNRDGMDSNATSTDGGMAYCSPDPALLLHSLVFRSIKLIPLFIQQRANLHED